jgi:hypothetical protein
MLETMDFLGNRARIRRFLGCDPTFRAQEVK